MLTDRYWQEMATEIEAKRAWRDTEVERLRHLLKAAVLDAGGAITISEGHQWGATGTGELRITQDPVTKAITLTIA